MLKEVRKSVKQDKTAWVDATIGAGEWDAIKKACRPKPHKQGRLRNLKGELVDSEEKSRYNG